MFLVFFRLVSGYTGEHESDPVTLTTVNKTVIFIHTVHAVTVDRGSTCECFKTT